MATLNTDNYTVGGIDLYFNASAEHGDLLATDGATTLGASALTGAKFRTDANSLGNIVTAEFNLDITYLDHFISVKGARRKDKTVAINKVLTIPFTFDEINEANLKRFFMASTLGSNLLAPMEEPLTEGSVSIFFYTDIGPDFIYSIPKATIRPDGALAMNVEDWWTGPMVLEVLYYDTGHWASKPYGYIDTTTISY